MLVSAVQQSESIIHLHMRVLTRVRLCDPVTVARQAPLSVGILQARIREGTAIPFSRGSSRPRD